VALAELEDGADEAGVRNVRADALAAADTGDAPAPEGMEVAVATWSDVQPGR
jgi:hypothetical protein